MKKIDLWPTRVAYGTIDFDLVMAVYNKYAEIDSKDWEEVCTEDLKNAVLKEVHGEYPGTYEIVDGWIRKTTTKDHNDFGIHCDNHYGNQLVAVLQVMGDEDCGGDLVLYDPSWSNPQWVSDTKNVDCNTFIVPFLMGQLVIFPSNVWHSVKEYHGLTNRITLNLMLRRVA